MSIRQLFISVWMCFFVLLSSCSGGNSTETASSTETVSSTENAFVNVQQVEYPLISRDEVGDQKENSPDLSALRAYYDDEFLYIQVEFDSEGTASEIQFIMHSIDDRQYIIYFYPEDATLEVTSPTSIGRESISARTSFDVALEIAIALDVFESPVKAISQVRAMVGTITVGDDIQGGPVTYQLGQTVQITTEPEQEPIEMDVNEVGDYVLPIGYLRDNTYSVELISTSSPPIFKSYRGPNGEFLFIPPWGLDSERIYYIDDNGNAQVYAHFPGTVINGFSIDSNGKLWFTDDHEGELFSVNESGEAVKEGVLHENNFVFDSNNVLYGILHLGSNIQAISPDGSREVYADGFNQLDWISMGPNDELVVLDAGDGKLYQIFPNNERLELLSGPPNVDKLYTTAFSPEGRLLVYVKADGLYEIHLDTLGVERIDWYDRLGGAENPIQFETETTLISYSQLGALRVDLEGKTFESVYFPKSNTFALAVGPDSEVYAAYADGIPGDGGSGGLYKLVGKSFELLLEFPFGNVNGLAISPENEAFMYLSDFTGNSGIFALDLNSPTELVSLLDREPVDIGFAYNPQEKELWWAVPGWSKENSLGYLTEDGEKNFISTPEGLFRTSLAFSPEGNLYAVLWFEPEQAGDAEPHGLFTYSHQEGWREIVDLTQTYPGIDWAIPMVCSDSEIYIIRSVDEDEIHEDRNSGISYNALYKVDTEGKLFLIGYDFSYDGTEAECDPATGELYFTSAAGIFRASR